MSDLNIHGVQNGGVFSGVGKFKKVEANDLKATNVWSVAKIANADEVSPLKSPDNDVEIINEQKDNPQVLLQQEAAKYQNTVDLIRTKFQYDSMYFSCLREPSLDSGVKTVNTTISKDGKSITTTERYDKDGNKLYEKAGNKEVFYDKSGNKLYEKTGDKEVFYDKSGNIIRENNGDESIYYDKEGNKIYRFERTGYDEGTVEFYDENGKVNYSENLKGGLLHLPGVDGELQLSIQDGAFLFITFPDDTEVYASDGNIMVQGPSDDLVFDATSGDVQSMTREHCLSDEGVRQTQTIYSDGSIEITTQESIVHPSKSVRTFPDGSVMIEEAPWGIKRHELNPDWKARVDALKETQDE